MNKVKWVSLMALTAGLLASLTTPASAAPGAAPASVGEVHNTGAIDIGAIQFRDNDYKHDTYDDLIPAGLFSGYPSTAGIYVGPGYCVRVRSWLAGTEQDPPDPDELSDPRIYQGGLNGVWVWFSGGIGRDVRALPSTDLGCAPD